MYLCGNSENGTIRAGIWFCVLGPERYLEDAGIAGNLQGDAGGVGGLRKEIWGPGNTECCLPYIESEETSPGS